MWEDGRSKAEGVGQWPSHRVSPFTKEFVFYPEIDGTSKNFHFLRTEVIHTLLSETEPYSSLEILFSIFL